MINLNEERQKKQRGYTVKEVLDEAVKGDYKTILIIGLDNDGMIDFYCSQDSCLEGIGLLEVAKEIEMSLMK